MLGHCKSRWVINGLASAISNFRLDKVHVLSDLGSYQHHVPTGNNMNNQLSPVCATVVCRTQSTLSGMVRILFNVQAVAESLKPDVEVWAVEKLHWLIAEPAVDSATEGAVVSKRLTTILSS